MRLLKTVVPGLLALLMLSLVASPMSAQVDEAAGSEFDELEGLQRAYSRSYTPDLMAMFGMATPSAEPTGWFALTAMAMEFDSEDSAEAAVDKMMEMITEGDMEVEDIDFQDASLDVDFDHRALQASQEEDGMTVQVLFAVTQDSNYLYVAVGLTMGDDPAPVTGEALGMMRDAEAEGGEGDFSDDGTSEGGLWDKLPTLEQMQELAPEFIGATDEITFPESDSTPAP
jgi:hypothetical protein